MRTSWLQLRNEQHWSRLINHNTNIVIKLVHTCSSYNITSSMSLYIQVACEDGTALLDIRLFSSKCSEFSKKFGGLATTEDFLEKWEEETKFCIST